MPRKIVTPDMYTPAMTTAIDRLHKRGVPFEVISPHHVKVGLLNFYPRRGVIYRDGDFKRLAEIGIDAFVSLVP